MCSTITLMNISSLYQANKLSGNPCIRFITTEVNAIDRSNRNLMQVHIFYVQLTSQVYPQKESTNIIQALFFVCGGGRVEFYQLSSILNFIDMIFIFYIFITTILYNPTHFVKDLYTCTGFQFIRGSYILKSVLVNSGWRR